MDSNGLTCKFHQIFSGHIVPILYKFFIPEIRAEENTPNMVYEVSMIPVPKPGRYYLEKKVIWTQPYERRHKEILSEYEQLKSRVPKNNHTSWPNG